MERVQRVAVEVKEMCRVATEPRSFTFRWRSSTSSLSSLRSRGALPCPAMFPVLLPVFLWGLWTSPKIVSLWSTSATMGRNGWKVPTVDAWKWSSGSPGRCRDRRSDNWRPLRIPWRSGSRWPRSQGWKDVPWCACRKGKNFYALRIALISRVEKCDKQFKQWIKLANLPKQCHRMP